jgi:hypothetical protein
MAQSLNCSEFIFPPCAESKKFQHRAREPLRRIEHLAGISYWQRAQSKDREHILQFRGHDCGFGNRSVRRGLVSIDIARRRTDDGREGKN